MVIFQENQHKFAWILACAEPKVQFQNRQMTGIISTIDNKGVAQALRRIKGVEKSEGQPKKNSVYGIHMGEFSEPICKKDWCTTTSLVT